jgi:hypothetical protein
MHESPENTIDRNRLDHVLPQGYLSGFTNPSHQGQISVFDCQKQGWFDTGTAGVAAIRAFYDYPPSSKPDQTADQAFSCLESKFPSVRGELVANGFSGWVKQLDFLLAFAQMLRTRSELFREEHTAHARQPPVFRVEEVLEVEPSKIRPGTFDTTLKYRPYPWKDETEHETLLRNKAITDMRTEIARGPGWFSELHWCLRLAGNPTDPVVTADNPIVVDGSAPTLQEALRQPETLIFFPMCWQACLVGSPGKFEKETDAFDPGDLGRLHALYLKSARRFVFSPARVDFGQARQ